MPTLERPETRLEYELHTPAGGERTPVLLTHGYGASRRMWSANVSALSRDRLVVAWDMRGHGASDAPDEASLYTHENCLLDMAALLDRVEAPRIVLCGMSLGGYLSLAFQQRFPERVVGLVLVDTGPGFRDPAARERWNQWANDLADRLDAQGMSALPAGHEQSPDQHVNGARGLAHAARGMLAQRDSSVFEALGQVAVPTLIVVGSEDTQFLAAADVMERRITGARKVVLEGAGHAANLDAPDQFNAAVSQFLEEL